MADRHETVRALVGDPWYQLSTAGQELFHTNMLYWLAVERPGQSEPIWELFGVDAPVGHVDPRGPIRREWRHVDLYVDSGMPCRKLVLENKVLAIPTSKQLIRYRNDLVGRPAFYDDVTSWVLLSLMRPTFRLPERWRHIGYDDLVPALEATAGNMDGDDRSLVAGYARLVRHLVDVRDAFDPVDNLDAPMLRDDVDTSVLQEGRALTLIQKMQASRCAELITRSLARASAGPTVEVNSGLTNTQGIVECYLPGPCKRHFGWQTQGSQFRLVVITSKRDPKKRPQRERLVEEGHANYFDFTLPPELDGLLLPYSGKKGWLGYEPDFVYQYQSLRPGVTWRQFIDIAVWFTHRTLKYVSEEEAS